METNRINATSNDKPNKYRNSNYRLYDIVTLNVLTKWNEYGPEHINSQWPLLNIGYQIMATPNQIQVSIISILIVRQQNQHIVGLQKQPTEINKIQYKSQINNQMFSLKYVSASGGSMVIC